MGHRGPRRHSCAKTKRKAAQACVTGHLLKPCFRSRGSIRNFVDVSSTILAGFNAQAQALIIATSLDDTAPSPSVFAGRHKELFRARRFVFVHVVPHNLNAATATCTSEHARVSTHK